MLGQIVSFNEKNSYSVYFTFKVRDKTDLSSIHIRCILHLKFVKKKLVYITFSQSVL
jgi:hypothetical protein